MKTGVIITSRYQSERLPGKALLEIEGKPMLWHIVDRARASRMVDEVIVATTPSSPQIVEFCVKEDIPYYVGAEDDILERLASATLQFNLDRVVRVWGDGPFVDPKVLDFLVMQYNDHGGGYEYMFPAGMPKGAMVSITTGFTYREFDRKLKDAHNRMWIHRYLTECPLVPTRTPIPPLGTALESLFTKDWNRVDLSVDTQKDLDTAREIFKDLYSTEKHFSIMDVLEWVEKYGSLERTGS